MEATGGQLAKDVYQGIERAGKYGSRGVILVSLQTLQCEPWPRGMNAGLEAPIEDILAGAPAQVSLRLLAYAVIWLVCAVLPSIVVPAARGEYMQIDPPAKPSRQW